MSTLRTAIASILAGSTILAAASSAAPGKGNGKPDGGSGTTQAAAEFTAQLAPTPVDGQNSSRLDIDFRLPGVDGVNWDANDDRVGIIQVSTPTGTLVRNNSRGECTDAGVSDGNRLDGYGIDGAPTDGVCDDQIDVGETLIVEVVGEVIGENAGDAAFDVSGIYLTDFIPDKNGEAGQITFTALDGTTSTYTFSWKKQPDTPVANNEVLVQFLTPGTNGGVVRFTKAEITATVGAFSVAGFEQTPIVLSNDACSGSQSAGDGCTALLAQGVSLDLAQNQNLPGDRGVSGTIYKNGVYRVTETRPYCLSGDGVPTPLPVDLNGGGTDLVMQPHQCGFADDTTGDAFFYVLDLDGGDLTVAEDTLAALFEDEGADNGYECLSPFSDQRPAIGWLPNAVDAIPVLKATFADNTTPMISKAMQDVTSGACGSSRGSFSRFSYVAYHWINAVDNTFAGNTSGTYPATDVRVIILERITNLQFYVDQLFGCVQQGVNQSTFSSDTGRIRQAFETANSDNKYRRTVELINEMVTDVLDPRVNDEIQAGACFYDNSTLSYTQEASGNVEANAVGNLLSQLAHLRWMVYTNFVATPYHGVGATFTEDNIPPDYLLD